MDRNNLDNLVQIISKFYDLNKNYKDFISTNDWSKRVDLFLVSISIFFFYKNGLNLFWVPNPF